MKITLNMMDLVGLGYSWNTIYTGLLYDFIGIDEVEKYAIKEMELQDYEDNEFVSELAWGEKEKTEIITIMLEGGLVRDGEIYEKHELNKIKYTILFYLRKQHDEEDFLRKIEEVYADFGYPEDMSAFIYYMPVNDNLTLTKKERELDLILKFDEYLIKLKNEIETNKV